MNLRIFLAAFVLLSWLVAPSVFSKDPAGTITAEGGLNIEAISNVNIEARHYEPGTPPDVNTDFDDDDDDDYYEDEEEDDVELAEEPDDPEEKGSALSRRQYQNVLLPLESLPGIGEAGTKIQLPYRVGGTSYYYEFELVGHKLLVRHYAVNNFGFNHGTPSLSQPYYSVAFSLVGLDAVVASDMLARKSEASFYLSEPVYSVTIQAQNGPKTVFEKMSARLVNQAVMQPKVGNQFYATHTFGLGYEVYTVVRELEGNESSSQFLVQNSEGQLAFLLVADPDKEEQMNYLSEKVAQQQEALNLSMMGLESTFAAPSTGIVSHGRNFLIYNDQSLPNLKAQLQQAAKAAQQETEVAAKGPSEESKTSVPFSPLHTSSCAAAFAPGTTIAKK